MKYVLPSLVLIAITGVCALTVYLNGGGSIAMSIGSWVQIQVTK